MGKLSFEDAFNALTDNKPFPWLRKLYEHWLAKGLFPSLCNIPTGLGKTSVVAVWLIALANHPDKQPRRLVYVVNRRTVVDQTTSEVEKLRLKLRAAGLFEPLTQLCAIPLHDDEPPLAISTLRGQFADNREWSADPARPAVIVGTVDMIGSRLLFGGYGVGFKAKPLHAGFLAQDALLVHDEAHLEPPFQTLIEAIRDEQQRRGEFRRFRVLALSATSRGQEEPLELTDEEKNPPDEIPDPPRSPTHVAWRRLKARKKIVLHPLEDHKKLADTIAALALKHKDSGRAVLVFTRKVDDVEKIVNQLPKGSAQQLTGTLRGLERDRLAKDDPIFARFLPLANRSPGVGLREGTVYLVCTSAGEVGVNISGDHLVCDLSTFDSMAQRFGRVNRFGDRADTRIDIVYPKEFDEEDKLELRLGKTLDLLTQLNGDGSPKALGNLDADARLAAFAPSPTILPVSDILFDAWALTTIRGKLPGRPPVEPYLHGTSGWEPPETHVAWRDEVGLITDALLGTYKPEDLLEDYPLKPHELLRDNSSRVFDRLKKLKAAEDTPVWVVADDEAVSIATLGELIAAGRDDLGYKTVLLPPSAGGLENGMLASESQTANDVADEWRDEKGNQRRVRVWDDDPQFGEKTKDMRLIRPPLDTKPPADDDEDDRSTGRRFWHWYESPKAGDGDGSRSNKKPVLWQVHTDDVVKNTAGFLAALPLSDDLKRAVTFAARWHDLGKKRELWQRSIGHHLPKNPKPDDWLGKSGGKMKPRELTDYRHEFGSLLDVLDPAQPHLAEFQTMSDEMKDVVLHLIAVHHGFGRPHFPRPYAFDPNANGQDVAKLTAEVPQRFARLQRRYGRWGLAYLESLLRAADWAASAKPSAFAEEKQ